jgi:putative transposase
MHHRRSLRLKGYDYSREGLYFITICTKGHQHYFGKISKREMILNETGCTAKLFLEELSIHFSHVKVEEHVVMPNHIHLILVLYDKRNVSIDGGLICAGPCHGVGPCHGMALQATNDGNVGTRHGVSPPPGLSPPPGISPPTRLFGQPIAGSVSVIINQYKASVKRWCNKNGHDCFQWQSRFHDHIIRNEKSCQNIVNYIRNNPKNWKDDTFF